MTVPTQTASGYMYWPLRAWVESLCTPQPDGTWLVQAPISGNQDPRLYLLPDTKTKDKYLWWTMAKGGIYISDQSLGSVFMALIFGANGLLIITTPDDYNNLAVISIFAGILFLLYFVPHVVVANRLFYLLPDARRQSAEIWLRQGMIVRHGVEWDAIYFSRGLAIALITTWLAIGIFIVSGTMLAVTTVDSCGSADILAGTFLETRRHGSPEASIICRNSYLWLGGIVLVTTIMCATLIRQRQKWKAGRAKLLPNRG